VPFFTKPAQEWILRNDDMAKGDLKMKYESLYHELKNHEGQSIDIHTTDGRTYSGINLAAVGDAVRILDRYGRTSFIPFDHICAVVEPMVKIETDPDDLPECEEESEDRLDDGD
jgi:hypothetical protein